MNLLVTGSAGFIGKNLVPRLKREEGITVIGYDVHNTEQELVEGIKKIARDRCAAPPHYEMRDIRMILEDDLFKIFLTKLEGVDYDETKKEHMRELAIKAMMDARL